MLRTRSTERSCFQSSLPRIITRDMRHSMMEQANRDLGEEGCSYLPRLIIVITLILACRATEVLGSTAREIGDANCGGSVSWLQKTRIDYEACLDITYISHDSKRCWTSSYRHSGSKRSYYRRPRFRKGCIHPLKRRLRWTNTIRWRCLGQSRPCWHPCGSWQVGTRLESLLEN